MLRNEGSIMSLLCSFSFSRSENERIVLDYSILMADMSEKNREKYGDYLWAVFDGVVGRRINMNQPFKLKAYLKEVEKRQGLNELKRDKKTLHIYEDDFDEAVSIPPYCVPMSAIPGTKGVEETVELDIELQESLDELRTGNLEIAAQTGVDIIYAMIASTRLTDDSLEESYAILRKVVADYPEIGDSIQILLDSGYEVDELFPEETEEYDRHHNTKRQKSISRYTKDDYLGF